VTEQSDAASGANSPDQAVEPELRATAAMELAGKLLTVAAVLLPLFGVAARTVAMLSTGLAVVPVAAAASISELTLSGLTPAIVLGLTVLATSRRASSIRSRQARDRERVREAQEAAKTSDDPFAVGAMLGFLIAKGLDESLDRIAIWAGRAISILLAIGLLVFLPGFPISIGFVVVQFAVLEWSKGIAQRYIKRPPSSDASDRRRPEKRASIYPFVTPLVLSLLLASTWAGFAGFGVGVVTATYEFKPDSGLRDGEYIRLAETDSQLYVMPCAGDPRTIVIPSDQVMLADLASGVGPTAPSLWAVLRGADVEFGLSARC